MWRKLLFCCGLFYLGTFTACTTPAQPSPTSVMVAGVTAVAPIAITPTAVTPAYPAPATQPAITASPEQPQVATLSPSSLPTPAAPIDDLSLSSGNVRLYPSPEIFAGEKVTFQVLAQVPSTLNPAEVTVHVLVDYQDVVSGTLDASTLQGSGVGLFEWAWDTTAKPGEHLVHIILDRYDTIQAGDENRDNNQAAFPVTVQDPAALSSLEQNAVWFTTETNCCTLHIVKGTAAERDLAQLSAAVETAVQQAATKLDVQPAQKLDIYLVDRVIGQGGYAGYAVVISYLDRSYANNGFHYVMTHEAVHILDRQFAPERINFLAEGLAVWASEGHYKLEDIDKRSAALATTAHYIPLPQLIDKFYPVQHEIGYLEAAGFVKFLIDNYGWLRFRDFYSEVTAEDATSLSTAVDLNLQQHFNTTLTAVEAQWLAYLTGLPPDQAVANDLETTIRFYNVMRRYQQIYDPAAYFLTAWLPQPEMLEQEGNPADLTRHPEAEINVALEVMLYAADTAWRAGNYQQANILLDSVTRVLDNGGAFVDPLAHTYLEVVQAAAEGGYEVQQVTLDGERASVRATKENSAALTVLTVVLSGGDWVLWN